jgi:hypothetical protein
MEDTDSMAIVATKNGGLIPCPGGPYRTAAGQDAVKALPWKQVEGIAERFKALNPYDRKAIPESILKIEDDNWDPITKKQRQLFCLAISAKRYALFLKDKNGSPILLRHIEKAKKYNDKNNNKKDRWSEHGLGHLLNPTDPENEDREWIAGAWLNIIRRALGLSTVSLGIEHSPAVGRLSVSSPAVMKPFSLINKKQKYDKQIKPFSFLVSCHVKELGHPVGIDPEHFHLIAPYEIDSRKWLQMDWIDEYSGKTYGITTAGHYGGRNTARVKTYGEVLTQYEFHPESKCADANGNPCNKQTLGLLQRRHIRIEQIKPIGKESNSLEDVEAGLIHSEKSVYTEYVNPRRDDWAVKILPALKKARLKVLVKMSGLSRRALIDARAGRSRPHRKNRELLVSVLRKLSLV